ncbi:MAG TPA: hypothetical protein VGU01_08555 [Sphingomicrobium sp.]|nr:hypothetical protein [Sphingomicrobium sp.]
MLKHFATKAVIAATGLAVILPAPAMANWRSSHPRRVEVNRRLRNLDHRIGEERREGDLTKAQAQTLRRDDRSIRQEERDMARLDKGHITRSDKRALNQQENVLSGQIPK